MDQPHDHARRTATNRLRNVLVLLYAALGVWVGIAAVQWWNSSEGMALLIIAMAIFAMVAGVVLAYFFSLFILGVLYRTRLSMIFVSILTLIGGPGLLALLVYFAL